VKEQEYRATLAACAVLLSPSAERSEVTADRQKKVVCSGLRIIQIGVAFIPVLVCRRGGSTVYEPVRPRGGSTLFSDCGPRRNPYHGDFRERKCHLDQRVNQRYLQSSGG